ncbi:putative lipid II flippase MurJ [Desulfoluna limicola]|uniref:Probable lipid II flippase MurJ n=1 Tax=Desulfoluna limicola TaxID=2810562 RepID=A0ABM7PGE1_9BACT|nr:murein biosynthesis integral membrane protein MurJ [Desulfoluna limicola]BCS96131.1 putative lipid II flippase MurJ [Desulfoluna limicola]
MSEKGNVTRAAGIVGSATLISRIFGYIRDMVTAYYFGAGPLADAFIAAFRIPNMLRRLFAEGSLSISFVPVFTETLKQDGRSEAFRMAGAALRLLSLVLTLVAVVGVLTSPWIVSAIAAGFKGDPWKYELTVQLSRIMFPYVVFICLVALCMGILNVLGHFAAPSLAPVALNLAMIASLVIGGMVTSDGEIRVTLLAWGVLLGGLLQLGMQIPVLWRRGFSFFKPGPLWHPALATVGRLMLPAVFGAAVYQVNMFIGTMLASLLDTGSITGLYYADRLVQFPLGIFAISIGTAVLPSLSRQMAENDLAGVAETFSFGLRFTLFITLPATVGLVVLREPLVALLFSRGAFDATAVSLTADALLFYAVGLWAISCVRVTVPLFYAFKDTRTPVRVAVAAILINIALSVLLMGPMAHRGLALAVSLSSMVNFLLLLFLLVKRGMVQLEYKTIFVSAAKSGMASLIMGGVVWQGLLCLMPAGGYTFSSAAISTTFGVTAGVVGYACAARVMKSPELSVIQQILNRRRGRSGG